MLFPTARLPVFLAVFFLTLSPALAQQSPGQSGSQTTDLRQRVETLLGVSGLPLGEATNVDVGQRIAIAGGDGALLAFALDEGGVALNVALSLKDYGIDAALPGKSSPLAGLRFPEALFILTSAEVNAPVSALPREVRDALRQAAPHGIGNQLVLKKGLNAFVIADFGSSALGSFLHDTLGIPTDPVTFVGTMPMEALVSAIKATARDGAPDTKRRTYEEWLRDFDLTATVGEKSLAGVPASFIQWPQAVTLGLSGKDGVFHATSQGEITIHVGGEALTFDLTADGTWSKDGDTPEGTVTGVLEGKHLVAFGGVSLSNLGLAGTLKDKAWDLAFHGDAKIGTKTVKSDITWTYGGHGNADYTVHASGALTLADLVPGTPLPGLDHLAVTDVVVSKDSIAAKLASGKHVYEVFVHPEGGDGTIVAVKADRLNLGEGLPGGAGALLKDLSLDAPLMVIETGKTARLLDMAELPSDMAEAIEHVAGRSVQLQPGVNVFATLDLGRSAAGGTLAGLGVKGPLPITGAIDPRVLASLIGHARGSGETGGDGGGDDGSLWAGISLSAPLPPISLPGLPNDGLFKTPSLHIGSLGGGGQSGGGEADKSPASNFSINTEFDISISGVRLAFPGRFDLGGDGFSFEGLSGGGWPAPFGVNWLRLDQLGISIAAKTGAGGREFAITLTGLTDLGSLKRAPVEIDLGIAGKAITGGTFKIKAPVAVTDIPALSHLPHLDGVRLGDLSVGIEGTGNARTLSLSGKIAAMGDLLRFEGLSVKDGTFKATEKGADWHLEFVADGTFRDKPVKLTATLDTGDKAQKEFSVTIDGDHSIAELLGAGAGPLDTVRLERVTVTGDTLDAKARLGGTLLDFAAFMLEGGKRRVFSMTAPAIDLGKGLPGPAGSALAEVMLRDAALVVVREGDHAEVASAKLPDELAKAVADVVGAKVSLRDGVNVFSTFDVRGAQNVSAVFGSLGVDRQIPISGTFNPAVLLNAFGQQAQGGGGEAGGGGSGLSGFSLSAPISSLKIPGLPGGFGFSNVKFSLGENGGGSGGAGGFRMAFDTDFAFTLGGRPFKASGGIEFADHDGARDITFNGAIPSGLDAPFDLKWLHVDDLAVKVALSTPSGGGDRGIKIDLSGIANLARIKGINVGINLDLSGGRLADAGLTLDGKMTLSDLPMLATLPRAGDIGIESLKIGITGAGDKTAEAKLTSAKLIDLPWFDLEAGTLSAHEGPQGWDAKGVNLLSGLQLQFSGTLLSYQWNRTNDRDSDNDKRSQQWSNSVQLSIPSVTYSLNIFNDNNDRNEVLARPTLVATDGKKSEFFSGAVWHVELSSGNSYYSDVSDVPVGLRLEVTPHFIDDETVMLDVTAARAFVESRANDAGFNNFAQTSKTLVTANVVMNFDQTLVLSGLSEKETEKIKDGVPFLQDLPLVQYLFSNETTLDFNKSVLILLTPRKPQYTYANGVPIPASPKAASSKAADPDRSPVAQLKSQPGWDFTPAPNLDAVMSHLDQATFFKEFRTGDVTLERWDRTDSLEYKIRKALDFIYY